MRQIKFRAWFDNGKAQDMFFAGDAYGTVHPLDCCRYLQDGQPVTLMQFTGLLDANGVEIYEGDIVSVPGIGIAEVEICPNYGVVFAGSDGFNNPHIDCVAEDDYPTVIGNIYQNQALLK